MAAGVIYTLFVHAPPNALNTLAEFCSARVCVVLPWKALARNTVAVLINNQLAAAATAARLYLIIDAAASCGFMGLLIELQTHSARPSVHSAARGQIPHRGLFSLWDTRDNWRLSVRSMKRNLVGPLML
jgi:hypothetical protein